jgi:Bacterial Ig-like domain (group 2)
MKIQSFVLLLCALALGVCAAACGGSSTSPSTVSSITVTGTAPAVGSSSQFTATETLSNGGVADVTGSAAWTSSDPGIATVSTTGMVTSLASGTVVISASYSGVAGAESIAVP